jgi:hypothetical protein
MAAWGVGGWGISMRWVENAVVRDCDIHHCLAGGFDLGFVRNLVVDNVHSSYHAIQSNFTGSGNGFDFGGDTDATYPEWRRYITVINSHAHHNGDEGFVCMSMSGITFSNCWSYNNGYSTYSTNSVYGWEFTGANISGSDFISDVQINDCVAADNYRLGGDPVHGKGTGFSYYGYSDCRNFQVNNLRVTGSYSGAVFNFIGASSIGNLQLSNIIIDGWGRTASYLDSGIAITFPSYCTADDVQLTNVMVKGRADIAWPADWDADTTYSKGDAVYHNSKRSVSLQDGNFNHEPAGFYPTPDDYWITWDPQWNCGIRVEVYTGGELKRLQMTNATVSDSMRGGINLYGKITHTSLVNVEASNCMSTGFAFNPADQTIESVIATNCHFNDNWRAADMTIAGSGFTVGYPPGTTSVIKKVILIGCEAKRNGLGVQMVADVELCLVDGTTDISDNIIFQIQGNITRLSSNVTRVVSDNYAMVDGDETILASAGSTDKTITILQAGTNKGKKITIIKTDGTAGGGVGKIIVARNSAEGSVMYLPLANPAGATSLPLMIQGQSITLLSDGTNWHVINDFKYYVDSIPVGFNCLVGFIAWSLAPGAYAPRYWICTVGGAGATFVPDSTGDTISWSNYNNTAVNGELVTFLTTNKRIITPLVGSGLLKVASGVPSTISLDGDTLHFLNGNGALSNPLSNPSFTNPSHVLPTGAGKTTEDIIAMLQTLGLVKQS